MKSLKVSRKKSELQKSSIVEESLEQLVSELISMLETVEESDSGKEFRPTTIQTCRCMHAKRLGEIIPKIKKICSKSVS